MVNTLMVIGIGLTTIGSILMIASIQTMRDIFNIKKSLLKKIKKAIKKGNETRYHYLKAVLEKEGYRIIKVKDEYTVVNQEYAESMKVKMDENIKVL